jgi:hypothetical protein
MTAKPVEPDRVVEVTIKRETAGTVVEAYAAGKIPRYAPRRLREEEQEQENPAEGPAYLTGKARAYVARVLYRQSTTVAALIEAGMDRDTTRFLCHQAVGQARLVPTKIKQQRERARVAKAVLPALNTIRAFVKTLERWDREDVESNTFDELLSRLERQAQQHIKPDPAVYGSSRQPELDDENKSRWAAVRAAIGVLAVEIEDFTGSPNEALVTNLAKELFDDARPGGQAIDDELVRRCRKTAAKLRGRPRGDWQV